MAVESKRENRNYFFLKNTSLCELIEIIEIIDRRRYDILASCFSSCRGRAHKQRIRIAVRVKLSVKTSEIRLEYDAKFIRKIITGRIKKKKQQQLKSTYDFMRASAGRN